MVHSSTISVRLDKPVLKNLEELEQKWQTDRSETIRRLLVQSIESLHKQSVIDLFKEHKVSLGKAAELLKVSVADMLGIAKEFGVDFVAYEKGDLERELKSLGV